MHVCNLIRILSGFFPSPTCTSEKRLRNDRKICDTVHGKKAPCASRVTLGVRPHRGLVLFFGIDFWSDLCLAVKSLIFKGAERLPVGKILSFVTEVSKSLAAGSQNFIYSLELQLWVFQKSCSWGRQTRLRERLSQKRTGSCFSHA